MRARVPSEKDQEKRRKERHDKFLELARGRTRQVIGKMRWLRKLANRHSYLWTELEAKQILAVVEKEYAALHHAFLPPGTTHEMPFDFQRPGQDGNYPEEGEK